MKDNAFYATVLQTVGKVAQEALDAVHAPYWAWHDGHMTPLEALRELCMTLGEIESELEPLETERGTLRSQISEVLTGIDGEKAEIKGFGVVRLTQASITKGYDKAKIQALINELIEDYPDIAARLVACETQTMRSGGLRIEREKAARQ